ncbi:MAG: hypothetical protein JWM21_3181 [Acidobacteria bacterium]|nr:hypothetical protein [Acidobacteriota bacterium]
MSTVEKVLEEVKTLTPGEQRQVHHLLNSLLENQAHPQATEGEFHQMLLKKGIICNIPNPADDADEDDEFEPVDVQGRPLSETVIEERR